MGREGEDEVAAEFVKVRQLHCNHFARAIKGPNGKEISAESIPKYYESLKS